eukprot:1160582-Pelagomonas_calceolata.AAC.11
MLCPFGGCLRLCSSFLLWAVCLDVGASTSWAAVTPLSMFWVEGACVPPWMLRANQASLLVHQKKRLAVNLASGGAACGFDFTPTLAWAQAAALSWGTVPCGRRPRIQTCSLHKSHNFLAHRKKGCTHTHNYLCTLHGSSCPELVQESCNV